MASGIKVCYTKVRGAAILFSSIVRYANINWVTNLIEIYVVCCHL